jgi:hypothetical protein
MEIWVIDSDGSHAVQMTNLLDRHQGSPVVAQRQGTTSHYKRTI